MKPRYSLSPISGAAAGLWLFGLLCLLLPWAVILLQAGTPSDGARISKKAGAWSPSGVVIHVYDPAGGLQDGDRVLAVNGVSLETWARSLFTGPAPQRPGTAGQPLVYTVQRGGEQLEQPIQPVSLPLWAIVRANWGVFTLAFVFQLVASIVLLFRPREAAARTLFIWACTASHFYIWSFYRQIPDLTNRPEFWSYTAVASFLWISNWAAGLHLTLTFPRPLPSLLRRPWLALLPYVAAFAVFSAYTALTWNRASGYLERIDNWQLGESLVPLALFVPTTWIMVHQYRRDPDWASRKKIRLVVFSGILGIGLTVFFYLLPPLLGLPSLDANLLGITLLLFPISIAIAILRYQLFDIDFIIRRTLVYSLLTASLALVYFSIIVLLQQVFGAYTRENSAPVVVISTLAIASLFTPFRRRIQVFIDRRFYRQRYNSEQIMARFSQRLREQVNMEQLSGHILELVQQTLQPESVSIWIITPARPSKAAPHPP